MARQPTIASSLPATVTLRWVCATVVVAALSMPGCRSETKPESPTTRETSGAETTGGPEASSTGAETVPASQPVTKPALPAPLDPGGCLVSGCHDGLARVDYRHGPFQAGACDACHGPEQPDHKFSLKRPGLEGCTFCHPVVGHKKHLHEVIAKDGCLPCHNPHGTNTKFLLTEASIELTCQGCHNIERKSRLHGPFAAGLCTTCHQPHESDNKFLLLGGEGRNHCMLCHRSTQQELLAASTVHEPVKEGCTQCHDPHSSENAYVLTKPIEELCFECHPDVEGKVAEAKSPHGAVFTADRCANCHDPHAQANPDLLRSDLLTLCLRCHDKPQKAYDGRTIPDMRPVLVQRKSLHGPVKAGQCNACHEVHGSSSAKLLVKYFPTKFYDAFDLANYALCFQCHSNAIVLEQTTWTLTNFRDGDRNLHYLHVNRPEKGRTCRTCHEIHGSNLPRHMASEVEFEGGGWSMPIGFGRTPDGGKCSPGCHKAYAYSRNRRLNPISRPSVENPQ